jgi:hypothetical protein
LAQCWPKGSKRDDQSTCKSFGLETDNRVIINMNPLKAGYKPEQLQGLYQQIEDKFHAMPGVERIGMTLYTPLEGNSWSFYVFVQGQRAPDPGQEVGATFIRASPDYFKAVGQRVVRGRAFTPADTATSPGVAVVNRAFRNRRCRGRFKVSERTRSGRANAKRHPYANLRGSAGDSVGGDAVEFSLKPRRNGSQAKTRSGGILAQKTLKTPATFLAPGSLGALKVFSLLSAKLVRRHHAKRTQI